LSLQKQLEVADSFPGIQGKKPAIPCQIEIPLNPQSQPKQPVPDVNESCGESLIDSGHFQHDAQNRKI